MTRARAARGRPPGLTPKGRDARDRLYRTAIEMFAERGYAETTLRGIARRAEVSPGLLYKYFPSKQAVVMRLYEQLTEEFVRRAEPMPAGNVAKRFRFALETSLATLAPHRATLTGLRSVLVGDESEGVLAAGTSFSRQRVQAVFDTAVRGARDAPPPEHAAAVGRLLYLAHLGVILWFLLDRSPGQRATDGLVALIGGVLPVLVMAVRVPPARGWMLSADELVRDGLLAGQSPSTHER